jgi:hypothetical protein
VAYGILENGPYLRRELHDPIVRNDDVLGKVPGLRVAGRRQARCHHGRARGEVRRAGRALSTKLLHRRA